MRRILWGGQSTTEICKKFYFEYLLLFSDLMQLSLRRILYFGLSI